MGLTMRQSTDTLTAARDRLKAKHVRFTAARRLVIERLNESSGPKSAADIAATTTGTIPVSSLYRTLSVLEVCGIIERFPDQAGIARYELAEWLTGHHHHMTCVECGATNDVTVPRDLEAAVADIASEVGGRFDFQVTGHRLDLHGVCRQCR